MVRRFPRGGRPAPWLFAAERGQDVDGFDEHVALLLFVEGGDMLVSVPMEAAKKPGSGRPFQGKAIWRDAHLMASVPDLCDLFRKRFYRMCGDERRGLDLILVPQLQ